MKIPNLTEAINAIRTGNLIAYPTEAVYGLGCDLFNERAVKKLLALKQRPIEKGLIVVGNTWEQLQIFAEVVPEQALQTALASWPGPYTWVFPASKNAPKWITGAHTSIALRVSAHPIVQALCAECGPLVSTSANISTQLACKTANEVRTIFGDQVIIVDGELGKLTQPTQIRDVLTQELIRM